MLTNLDWLNSGEIFPPAQEKKRLEQYAINAKVFDTEHAEAFRALFEDYARKIGKRTMADVSTVINYQQLLSKKTADFVCGEPPTVELEANADILERVLARARFNAKLYEAVIDISRYGNAVIKLGDRLTAVQPQNWFPIVGEGDLKHITKQVIAYGTNHDKDGSPTQLYAEIHSPDKIEVRRLHLKDGVIGGLIDEPEHFDTTTGDFDLFVLSNVTHSGSVYGIDDYKPINDIVAKLIWRLHCVDKILDKHSEPTMSGPQTALKYDQRTGMSYFDLGTFLSRNDNSDPELKYITWDGNLEAAYKEIDKLTELLYTITEMGQAFMVGGGGGEAQSGTALKLKMVAPRIKAARIVGINEDEVKRLIYAISKQNGIEINFDELTIHWNDGLPDDEAEQTATLIAAVGGKPIMSQYSALKRQGLTDAQVEAELDQISAEQSLSMPSLLSVFDQNMARAADDTIND